jgi:hypothetical protein
MNQRTPARSRFVRTARDFLLGLGLYAALAVGAAYLPDRSTPENPHVFSSRAYAAVQLVTAAAPPSSATATVFRSTDAREATAILGLAFASLVAMNLAFFRHLRRVYASPR